MPNAATAVALVPNAATGNLPPETSAGKMTFIGQLQNPGLLLLLLYFSNMVKWISPKIPKQFCSLIGQIGQIHFAVLTNTFYNLDKYIYKYFDTCVYAEFTRFFVAKLGDVDDRQVCAQIRLGTAVI